MNRHQNDVTIRSKGPGCWMLDAVNWNFISKGIGTADVQQNKTKTIENNRC